MCTRMHTWVQISARVGTTPPRAVRPFLPFHRCWPTPPKEVAVVAPRPYRYGNINIHIIMHKRFPSSYRRRSGNERAAYYNNILVTILWCTFIYLQKRVSLYILYYIIISVCVIHYYHSVPTYIYIYERHIDNIVRSHNVRLGRVR